MSTEFSHIAGVILAGGKNSRMGGQNKALIQVGTNTILQHATECLQHLFDEIILVTNHQEDYTYNSFPYHFVSDYYPNLGPVGGLHAALKTTSKQAIMVVACDMPNLQVNVMADLLRQYNSNYDAVVSRIDGQSQPLHAIYSISILPVLETYIEGEQKRSMFGLLGKINVLYVDFLANNQQNPFVNLNTPNDLEGFINGC